MELPQVLNFLEFQKAIVKKLKQFRRSYIIIIVCGVIAPWILYFWEYSAEFKNSSNEYMMIFSLVHIGMAITFYIATHFFFLYLTNPKNLIKIDGPIRSNQTPEEKYLNHASVASLIRCAIYEGVAVFGIIIFFNCLKKGYLQEHPFYWLNLLPSIIFVVLILYTFPTQNRLENIFRKRCITKPPHSG